MINDTRAYPTAEWIQSIRSQYPVEPAVDIALTGKLQNRSTARYEHTDIGLIGDCLERYLTAKLNA